MTVAIAVALVAAVLTLWLVSRHRSDVPSAVDSERTMRVGVELHGVRRRLDVAWTRSQLHRDADAARREIADLLQTMEGERDDRW